jgi:hypothetical protein
VEAELLLRKARVRGQVGHVAAPPADHLRLVVEAGRLAHRVDDLEHGHAAALAEVVRLVPRLVRAVVERGRVVGERVEREEVALAEVEDVDVVADAGAVAVRECERRGARCGDGACLRGGVVVAEDFQDGVLDPAYRHVCKERKEIARTASRVFANETGGVRTCRAKTRVSGKYTKE